MSDFEFPSLDAFRKLARKIQSKHKSVAGAIKTIADVRKASNKALKKFEDSEDYQKKVQDIRKAYEETTMLPEMRDKNFERVKINLVEDRDVARQLNEQANGLSLVNFDFSDYKDLPDYVRPEVLYITTKVGDRKVIALVGSEAARGLSMASGISVGDIQIKFPGHAAFSVYGPEARKIGQMFAVGRKSKTMRKGLRDDEAKIVADVIVRVTGGYGLMSAVTGLNLAARQDLVKFPNPHASAVGASGIAQLALAGSGAYGDAYKDLKTAKAALDAGQHLRFTEGFKSAKQRTGLRANKGLVWNGEKWEEMHKFVRGGPRPICHPGISKRLQQTRMKDGACASMGRRLSSVKKDTAALSIAASGRVTDAIWAPYYKKSSEQMAERIGHLVEIWNASADRKTPIKYALRAITLFELSKIKDKDVNDARPLLGDMVISGVAVGKLSKQDLLYLAGGLLRVAENVGFNGAPGVEVTEVRDSTEQSVRNGYRAGERFFSSKEFVSSAITAGNVTARDVDDRSPIQSSKFKVRAAARAAARAGAAAAPPA